MCRAPLGTRKLRSRFYHDCILHRQNLQTEEVTECGSYHSTNKGQRSGGSETLHGQRCPRPQGREMTGGLFPRQLPGPRLGMQGSRMAGAASDFPGVSEHLLPSLPQPPGLSRWSQKLQDLLGGFPAGGSCPPQGSWQTGTAWTSCSSLVGSQSRPSALPSSGSFPPFPVGVLPTPEDRLLQPGVLTLDCAAECPRGHSDPDSQAQPQSLVWRPV